MAGSVNKVILVGRLSRDVEVRFTNDGSKIVNMNVVTSETWKSKQTGEKQERAEFHRVVVFNDRLADLAEQYLRKGSQVFLEGSLQTRKWTDQSGVEKYTTEIVLQKYKGEMTFLGGGKSQDGGYDQGQQQGGYGQQSHGGGGEAPSDGFGSGMPGGDLDEPIPFITRWGVE